MFTELMRKIWKNINKMKQASSALDFDPNDKYFSNDRFLKETLKSLHIILENVGHLNEDLPKAIASLEKEVERRVNNGKTS